MAEQERSFDVAHLLDVGDAFHLVGGGLLYGRDLFAAQGGPLAVLPCFRGDADGEGLVEVVDVHAEGKGESRLHHLGRHHLACLVFGDGVGRHREADPLAQLALREAPHPSRVG